MPYIEESRRVELHTDPSLAENGGDYNFLFSEAILKIWNATPRYQTIHNLRLATKGGFLFSEIVDIYRIILAKNEQLDERQLNVAFDLAFQEFYIRVGRSYENEAINKNGDLGGYTEAYKHLNELARERFNKNIKYVEIDTKETK